MKTLEPDDRVHNLRQRTDFGAEVVVHGWLRTRRDSKGGFSFLELNDGSSLKGIQIVADGSLPNYEAEIMHTATGCSLRVVGELKESQGKGQPVEV
ncbi:MAG: OB-fold nucleic acid binding domain-containing protein, partial [Planctomycetota bacterium]|nr:OB-fold nucleic acid binding domain-containing protein [Planctomycetota bacterium]